MKKKGKLITGMLGGLSLVGIGGMSIFSPNFNFLSFNKTENYIVNKIQVPEIKIDQETERAKEALSIFYRKLNLHQFDQARELLTENAKVRIPYQTDQLEMWINSMKGPLSISPINEEIGESTKTTKVFSYRISYTLKSNLPTPQFRDQPRRAYLVLKEGNWLIEPIQDTNL